MFGAVVVVLDVVVHCSNEFVHAAEGSSPEEIVRLVSPRWVSFDRVDLSFLTAPSRTQFPSPSFGYGNSVSCDRDVDGLVQKFLLEM